MFATAALLLVTSAVSSGLGNYDIEHRERECRSWSAFETDAGDRIELSVATNLRVISSIEVEIGGHKAVIPAALYSELKAVSVAFTDWSTESKTDTKELTIYANRECVQGNVYPWANASERWLQVKFTFVHGKLVRRTLLHAFIDGEPPIEVTELGGS